MKEKLNSKRKSFRGKLETLGIEAVSFMYFFFLRVIFPQFVSFYLVQKLLKFFEILSVNINK